MSASARARCRPCRGWLRHVEGIHEITSGLKRLPALSAEGRCDGYSSYRLHVCTQDTCSLLKAAGYNEAAGPLRHVWGQLECDCPGPCLHLSSYPCAACMLHPFRFRAVQVHVVLFPQVNDKKLIRPMRVRLKYKETNGLMEE